MIEWMQTNTQFLKAIFHCSLMSRAKGKYPINSVKCARVVSQWINIEKAHIFIDLEHSPHVSRTSTGELCDSHTVRAVLSPFFIKCDLRTHILWQTVMEYAFLLLFRSTVVARLPIFFWCACCVKKSCSVCRIMFLFSWPCITSSPVYIYQVNHRFMTPFSSVAGLLKRGMPN